MERAATSAASNVFDPRSTALKLSYGGGGGSSIGGGDGNTSTAHLGIIVFAALAVGALVIKCCFPSTRSRYSRLYKFV